MHKSSKLGKYIFFIIIIISITGCVTGTGKNPAMTRGSFSSITLQDVTYYLQSESKNYQKSDEKIGMMLEINNTTSRIKKYKIKQGTFLVCYLKNKKKKVIEKIKLPARIFFRGDSFQLLPGEVKSFSFDIYPQGPILAENEILHLETKLVFLKKQLRRNRLSVILQRDE